MITVCKTTSRLGYDHAILATKAAILAGGTSASKCSSCGKWHANIPNKTGAEAGR